MARPDRPSDPAPVRQLLGAHTASFTDEGQGPCLIALHGVPGSVRDFRWLAPAVTAGCRLIRLELPGFGGAPSGDVGPSLTALGGYVADAVRALELPRVALLGHSFGALVAASAAHQLGEQAAGVALINPVGLTPHVGLRRLGPLWAWRAGHHHPLCRVAVRPVARRMFEQAGFRGVTHAQVGRSLDVVARARFETHRSLVSTLPGRTFVAWADDDPVVEAPISLALAQACPAGPRLRFLHGGHRLNKVEAVAIGRALRRWLRVDLGLG